MPDNGCFHAPQATGPSTRFVQSNELASEARALPVMRVRGGGGRAGKPGVRLRLEDLQSHFGLRLKQAAEKMGVCSSTLKRACR
jgi:hypothetical protein